MFDQNIAGWLLSSEPFVPRSQCGDWTEELIALYLFSDGLLALSFIAIPVALYPLWMLRRKQSTRGSYLILLFIAFIFLCGLTHFCNVLVFWWPAYRLFVLANIAASLVSALTAVVLPFWIVATLKTPVVQQALKEVEGGRDKVNELETALRQRDKHIAELSTSLNFQKKMYRNLSVLLQNTYDKDLQGIKNILREASVLLSQIPDSDSNRGPGGK